MICLVYMFAGALVNALGAIVLGAPVGTQYVMVVCTEILFIRLSCLKMLSFSCGWIKMALI